MRSKRTQSFIPSGFDRIWGAKILADRPAQSLALSGFNCDRLPRSQGRGKPGCKGNKKPQTHTEHEFEVYFKRQFELSAPSLTLTGYGFEGNFGQFLKEMARAQKCPQTLVLLGFEGICLAHKKRTKLTLSYSGTVFFVANICIHSLIRVAVVRKSLFPLPRQGPA